MSNLYIPIFYRIHTKFLIYVFSSRISFFFRIQPRDLVSLRSLCCNLIFLNSVPKYNFPLKNLTPNFSRKYYFRKLKSGESDVYFTQARELIHLFKGPLSAASMGQSAFSPCDKRRRHGARYPEEKRSESARERHHEVNRIKHNCIAARN